MTSVSSFRVPNVPNVPNVPDVPNVRSRYRITKFGETVARAEARRLQELVRLARSSGSRLGARDDLVSCVDGTRASG